MEMLVPEGPQIGAVLVIPSWWGLTPSFHRYGAALAHAGYRVGLADLFDGETATTLAQARSLRARKRKIPCYRTLGASIAALRHASGQPDRRIGVVGFSMGGHWAIWLSQRPEYHIGACTVYYAARAGDFHHCQAGVLAHFAGSDEWVSTSARRSMERALQVARCAYCAHDYPGTRHWFAEHDRVEAFDPAAAALALNRDLHHLRAHLAQEQPPARRRTD